MINTRFPGRSLLNISLLLSITVSCGLLLARIIYTGEITFAFLVWNIFLAIIPYSISSLIIYSREQVNISILIIASIPWLLFLPNTMYIITDLFHFKYRAGVPPWFDLMLIFSFAWNGLILGLISLSDMQKIYSDKIHPIAAKVLIVTAMAASSFGVYIGRYLRWNSWDAITNPLSLLHDIGSSLLFGPNRLALVGGSFILFSFLILSYTTLRNYATANKN